MGEPRESHKRYKDGLVRILTRLWSEVQAGLTLWLWQKEGSLAFGTWGFFSRDGMFSVNNVTGRLETSLFPSGAKVFGSLIGCRFVQSFVQSPDPLCKRIDRSVAYG